MCIGIPMQVERVEPGHAWARGRGELSRIETALVEPCRVGDWLLVFLGRAREQLDAVRAAEVSAALDLLDAALLGDVAQAQRTEIGFALPSALGEDELRALTGAARRSEGKQP